MIAPNRSPLEQLQRRTEIGLTTFQRMELAVALGTMPESGRVAEILGRPLPEPRSDIRSLGKFLFEHGSQGEAESYARFALVCAETLMPTIPNALLTKCHDLLVRAYAHITAPQHQTFNLDALRAEYGMQEAWSDWLSHVSVTLEHAEQSRQSMSYMGFGLCMTCVQEWLGQGQRFLITDPSQLAGYADYGDHKVFWEVLRRDYIPWLLGGPLP